jgi:hypothetical protein
MAEPPEMKGVPVEIRRVSRLASLLALILVVVAARPAEARNPEDVFRGQVLTSRKRFPMSDKSANAYISKLRAAKSDRFYEDKETQSWKIYFAAFFRRPLNDLEVTVRLFDITNGGKKLITAFEQYLEGRGARSVISSVKLERKYVGVNKHVLIVLESRGTVLSSGKFYLLGEGEKYTGEVSFTEDEAKNGAEE